jgi:hypothetical protein
MQNACARLHLHVRTGKKDVVYYEVKCLPTASALPAPRNGDFGMSRFKGQLLANIHSRSGFAEGQEWLKEPFSMCQEFRHEIPLCLQSADSAARGHIQLADHDKMDRISDITLMGA